MDRIQRTIIISLIGTSALAWSASINQPDMMVAMTTYNPLAISVFTASWTAGMAAMMFPAITPMVLMYNRLVTNQENNRGRQSSVTIERQEQKGKRTTLIPPSIKNILFVGSYLLVWALTGIGLLLGWSLVMNNTIMTAGGNGIVQYLYGILLIIAGAYQFTPLKRICIGYCESPISFFMRRWKDGTFGALRMGLYHGIYCLGCCWAYFLLMVALGWMNLLWMGLFAAIIFGEKIWSKGIWVARGAGLGLIIVGIFVSAGMLPSLISSATSTMADQGNDGNGMESMVQDNSAMSNKTDDSMIMDNMNARGSTDITDNDASSTDLTDHYDNTVSRPLNDMGGSENPMKSDKGDNKQPSMKDME